MIYIDTKSDSPYINFAFEYFFSAEKILDDKVFLFWKTKPTLMIGKYQNAYEEVNLPYAKEHNIMLVRRMSGGGTIYTDEGGRQYTIISHDSRNEISFTEYCSLVINALHILGVDAELTGRNDILVAGRKISGTAQYKQGEMTVHHGSLLFDTDIDEMVRSTNVNSENIVSKSIKSVRERVTNIKDHINDRENSDDFINRMLSLIIKDADIYQPTENELERIRQIAYEKFEAPENLFGRNPEFSISRSYRFKGGRVTAKIGQKGNIITGVALSGDFFSSIAQDHFEKSLIGVEMSKEKVQKALESNLAGDSFFGISLCELASLIVGEYGQC